jgi:hypothetical protein
VKPVSTPKSVNKGSGNAAKRVMAGNATMSDIEAFAAEMLAS